MDTAQDLKGSVLARIDGKSPFGVWTPVDFIDLGSRPAVDQVLHRLTASGAIRRVTRGLYDKPAKNKLTGKDTTPDPRAVIDALVRRDSIRVLVDGMTAANDLGLSDAVPARIVVHTDSRLRALTLGPLTISFMKTAPSKLYWAGRPGMRVVQALNWLKDKLPTERDIIAQKLRAALRDSEHGEAIKADLRDGYSVMPDWMRTFLRPLVDDASLAANSINSSIVTTVV